MTFSQWYVTLPLVTSKDLGQFMACHKIYSMSVEPPSTIVRVAIDIC